MDSLVALDAQIISQLRDTNIQINRLMVLQLNRLHDTIKQLQQADSDTNNQDPRLPGRIQQLQTLLPTMKTTLEHQQTFYHQCLRLQHIPTTLHHQVLRLATTLDKTHTTSTSTPTFERSNPPPSPRQTKTEPTPPTISRSTIRLQERPHHHTHHKLSEQPLLIWQPRTSSAASHSHTAKHSHHHTQRSRSHSRHTHTTSDKLLPHDANVTAHPHVTLTDTPALSLTAHILHTSANIIQSIPNNITNNQSNHTAPTLVPDDLTHDVPTLPTPEKAVESDRHDPHTTAPLAGQDLKHHQHRPEPPHPATRLNTILPGTLHELPQ